VAIRVADPFFIALCLSGFKHSLIFFSKKPGDLPGKEIKVGFAHDLTFLLSDKILKGLITAQIDTLWILIKN